MANIDDEEMLNALKIFMRRELTPEEKAEFDEGVDTSRMGLKPYYEVYDTGSLNDASIMGVRQDYEHNPLAPERKGFSVIRGLKDPDDPFFRDIVNIAAEYPDEHALVRLLVAGRQESPKEELKRLFGEDARGIARDELNEEVYSRMIPDVEAGVPKFSEYVPEGVNEQDRRELFGQILKSWRHSFLKRHPDISDEQLKEPASMSESQMHSWTPEDPIG